MLSDDEILAAIRTELTGANDVFPSDRAVARAAYRKALGWAAATVGITASDHDEAWKLIRAMIHELEGEA